MKKIFMNFFKNALLVLSIGLPLCAHALVDYTESPRSQAGAAPASNSTSSENVIRRTRPSNNQAGGSGMFRLGSQFESVRVQTDEGEEKVDFMKFQAQFMTQYDVFLDVRYWMTPSSALDILGHEGEQSSTHQGNARTVLGFNWMNFGGGPTAGNVDLYGGASIRASESSAFGASRTDMVLGVMTSKRFHSLALGLGYELVRTGNPGKDAELSIGDIQKFHASLGWRVSPDIQMMLEGATYRIGSSEQTERTFYLQESQTFASVTPSMVLRLSHLMRLRLGATFQTNKVDDPKEMVRARLWDIDGLYGNRLFAGLSFSL